ncbi:short-chain collagen C4-like [Ruditapes philippinarum]|uniref:short-chain collagen C4-like n=1 Tax=Ruditapes philippinarum TaxID=129788 RepID=UPI00295B1674|nr:short-chain collagen C4-like [Ruditapes philippinarum]
MCFVFYISFFLISASEIFCRDRNNRLLLHDDASLVQAYQTLAAEVNAMKSEITTLKSTVATLQSYTGTGGHSLYVRWGRTSCPANGTHLVYSGFSAGFYYGKSGGATNHLCLPTDPQWAHYDDSVTSGSKIYGVEYQFGDTFSDQGSAFFGGEHIYEEDAPCAVCQSTRPIMMMLPGRLDCYPGWTKEYNGYLVSEADGHASASEYICLDSRPEVVMGGHANNNGRLFYLVEGVCGSLKCPPYVEGRELTCVVCTK